MFPAVAQMVAPPPPPPQSGVPQGIAPQSGRALRINGVPQQARWQLQGQPGSLQALWLPLEVLQNQLGVESRSSSDGSLKLDWFGHELVVPASGQRSLDDEVSVESSALLQSVGVRIGLQAGELALELPAPRLLGVRNSNKGSQRRIVLDLSGPALMRRDGTSTWLGLSSDESQQRDLLALGLSSRSSGSGLRLQLGAAAGQRLFSLGGPERIVIDLPLSDGGAEPAPPEARDPRLQALLGKQLQWERQLRGGVRLTAVRVDPRDPSLQLRPLARSSGMEGLSSLQQLAAQDDALVAINGGYFNRVKRLPLGALKVDGRWLSGPILGRGVVAWSPGSMPQFGRLSLQEWVSDSQGNRVPVVVLNSGYVQRGLSRYTADWGPSYRALSGEERALVLRSGRVQTLYDQDQLEGGVPLRPGETLLVARGGSELPWAIGDGLRLSSQASNALGQLPHVIGAGPLLLLDGRIVLNGGQENFSSGFLQQGAPRSVIASDGSRLWLITLEGNGDAGPSLGETASLLQQLGLRDALNLDGGSSTGLVMGGVLTVKGRGVAGAVHHGLGLVPSTARVRSALASTPGIQP